MANVVGSPKKSDIKRWAIEIIKENSTLIAKVILTNEDKYAGYSFFLSIK